MIEEKHQGEHFEAATNATASKEGSGSSTQFEEEEPSLHWRSLAVVLACGVWYAGSLIVLLASGFWLTSIVADIGGAATGLWLSQGFNLFATVLAPIFGQIGDSCGRRYLMISAISLGIVGLIVAATAKSMSVAILGTVLYGPCWALTGTAFSIVSEVTTHRWRPRAQQSMNIMGSIGLISGVLIQAEFITVNSVSRGWRYTFWLPCGILVLADILFIVLYHPSSPPNPRNLSAWGRFLETDLVGAGLLAISTTPILIGIIWGGATAPWSSAQVLAPLCLGIALLFLLAYHQIRIKKDGLFNHALFKNRNVVIGCFGFFVEGMIYTIFTQYYGVVTATLYETRNTLLALRYCSFLFANITGAFIVQWYSYRFRQVKAPLIVGFLLFLGAMIGMSTLTPTPTMGKLAVLWAALGGFGFSAPVALLVVVAQLGCAPEMIGLVTGLVISSRTLGGAIGVAIATAITDQKLASALPSYISKAALGAGLPESSLATFVAGISASNSTMAGTAPGVTAAILAAGTSAALEAHAFALKYIWIVIIPFTVVATVLCFFLQTVTESMNYDVDRPEEATQHHPDHVLEHGKGISKIN